MRKIICLILNVSLLIQSLIVPLSVLAQTEVSSKATNTPRVVRHLEGGPPTATQLWRDSFQVEKSVQDKVKGLTSSSVLSYDSSGNLINDGSRVITWDVEGKPVKVVQGNSQVLFLYDNNGTRIGKIVNDRTTGNLSSATLYLV